MTLVVYNTQTSKKEAFTPHDNNNVSMYVCGPTVYDMSHIGHARAYVSFDTIFRYLQHRGYSVHYVRNYTDVDDKIIKRANEQSVSTIELSSKYIDEFKKDMSLLGCIEPITEPKVTDNIEHIVSFIERLIEKHHAYESDGDVYFSVSSFNEYGKLSGRKTEDLKAGARVAVDEKKQDPLDFVLWKSSKANEPSWDSPWGKGRPGWHIECSVMSSRFLGETIDIHGGGKDLIFPHHENELAQSECAHNKPFVRYWLHNGFVNIDGEKMAKSLGNFFTIREVIERYHPEALRYFLLTTHYRAPINFSQIPLEEAEQRIHYLYTTWNKLLSVLTDYSDQAGTLPDTLKNLSDDFHAAMDDDFNTASALGLLSDSFKLINELSSKAGKKLKTQLPTLKALHDLVAPLCAPLGILQSDPSVVLDDIKNRRIKRHNIDVISVEKKITSRNEARSQKDWQQADSIRDELLEQNIIIFDTPQGTTWEIAK